jgi:hypothetical protein
MCVNFVSILVLFNASISLDIKKRIGLIQQQFNQREFQKNTNTQLDFLENNSEATSDT